MPQIVSITSQGQLTIPASIRDLLGIRERTKATIRVEDDKIVVRPENDFWSLGGTLESKIKLSDQQLQKARKAFEKQWAQK